MPERTHLKQFVLKIQLFPQVHGATKTKRIPQLCLMKYYESSTAVQLFVIYIDKNCFQWSIFVTSAEPELFFRPCLHINIFSLFTV